MKKSLVLAMAMALGVTASAYAANPFSDVPAGHWAYDSIDKLAAAGVVDGMGDGTFQGDRTMTRYEMAQIVAKAMAKGANVDKLAAEFADELDALGVRVAALEKKADNVKISGNFKASLWNYHGTASKDNESNNKYRLRSDLNITGQINEDWAYHAKIRNDQYLDNDNAGKGEETASFKDAYVTGRLGGLNIIAGRYNDFLEDGNILDDRGDMIVASYGKDVKVTAGYGQYDASMQGKYNALSADDKKKDENKVLNGKDLKFAYGRVDTKLGVVGAHVAYYAFEDAAYVGDDSNIFAAGVELPVAKHLNLAATYLHSDAGMNKYEKKEIDQDGFVVALDYKGADMAKPGSFGIYAKYYDQPEGTVICHTMDGYLPLDGTGEYGGFKGAMIGAKYTLAKNIQFNLDYYALEGKETGKNYDTLYSMLNFAF